MPTGSSKSPAELIKVSSIEISFAEKIGRSYKDIEIY